MSNGYKQTMLLQKAHVLVFIIVHVLTCRGDEASDFIGAIEDGFGGVMDNFDTFDTTGFDQIQHEILPQITSTKQQHFIELTGKSNSHVTATCGQLMTQGGWGYYSYHGSCNQYIHCDKQSNGFLETCARGTFFNGHQCVRAEDVDCFFDPCRTLPTGHWYSDGQTCYGFYKCLHGKSVPGLCPPGYSFNSVKHDCIPDMTCSQETNHLHPCHAGTTMPFPGQPHLFYLWDGHQSVSEMSCPNGLWYNPKVCSCDWVIPGTKVLDSCVPMFHFGYNGNFLEEYNKAPQAPNTAVSLYKNSALFNSDGHIVIWMMNDIDMDANWALCFEFMSAGLQKGEIALVSNDWEDSLFTYKLTYIPSQHAVRGYFRMKDGGVIEMMVYGVYPHQPHFVRVAKIGHVMKLRVDNIPPAVITTDVGVASSPVPMVVGSAKECNGFVGFFDELKFFRCVPETFFSDYNYKDYH